MLWLTKDVSIRLLARTADRTWVRCCSGRTVRNSESLCGLRCTLQERWGRGKARALLGPLAVRTYRTGVKALSCQSRADESEGFVGSKPCGRADKSEGFVGSKPCGRSDGNEGFVMSKPCRRERRLCRVKSRAGERTRAKALSGQSRADERTGQKAEAKMGVILALRR